MEARPTENRMGTEPVPKLLIKMSVPMMASMLVQALYNVVDSIFVSRVSEDALNAVSLAFPLQMLIIALGVGTGIGVNSLIARRLGEKRQANADAAAVTGQFLALITSIVFMLIYAFLSRPLLALLITPSDMDAIANILDMAVSYLSICGGFCIFSIFQIVGEKTLQGAGDMMHPMLIQLVGAIVNIIFDPILIFGYFGFPAMGVAGAAVATVFAQAVGMCLAFYYLFRKKNRLIRIRIKGFRPEWRVIGHIYRVGLPSIFMQAIGSFTTLTLNGIMLSFTPTAVGVLGVYYKLQSFVFMPVFGLNSGAMPIMGYNYGARNRARLLSALRYGILYALIIMAVGTLLFQLMPGVFFGLFEASADMLQIGSVALRVISISFPVVAFCIMFSSLFQAVGFGILSLLISALRQIVVIIPAALILANTLGLNAVWWAFPIAEVVALGVCILTFIHVYRKHIKHLDGSELLSA